jgi:hypothetical protein
MVMTTIAALALAWLPVQESAEKPKEDPQLAAVVAKTLAAKNYAFTCTTETAAAPGSAPPAGEAGDAGGRGNRGGGGGGGAERNNSDRNTKVEGKWQAGSPTHLEVGAMQAFGIDDQLVYRRGEGTGSDWEKFDEIAAGERLGGNNRGGAQGGGATGGATGGGAPSAGGTTGGGTTGGATGGAGGGTLMPGSRMPTGLMQSRTLFTLQATRPPHELVARLASGIVEPKRREADGKVIFEGALTPALVQRYSGFDQVRRMSAQSGRGGGGTAPATATVELVLGADGYVESVTIRSTIKGRRGDQLRTLTYRLRDFETTEYEVPKGALDLLAT